MPKTMVPLLQVQAHRGSSSPDGLIHIYYGEQLARELVPDPTRAYHVVRRKAVR
ncbi:MAG: hypothetical protein ACRDJO_04445 [Actinomycetota bacterium]